MPHFSSEASSPVLFSCSRLFLVSLALSLLVCSCRSAAPTTPEEERLAIILRNAEVAVDGDDYATASKALVRALVISEDIAPSRSRLIRKRLCGTYLDWARSLYWKGKSENFAEHLAEAVRLCVKAGKVYPRSKRKCDVYAARFRSDLNSIRYKKSTALETIDPGFKERSYKVDVLRKQALVLRKMGEYMQAKDKLNELLRLDPYDIAATRELRSIMKNVAAAGERRASVDKAERVAEVAWKNVNPIEAKTTEENVSTPNSESDLRSKLESYTIGEIDFKDAPLDEALDMLEQDVRKFLSSSFKLTFKDFSPKDPKWPKVTFKTSSIPVLEAFKAICGGVGLSLKVFDDSVEITPRR